jgi:hypothetical protein
MGEGKVPTKSEIVSVKSRIVLRESGMVLTEFGSVSELLSPLLPWLPP